jgi:hypothetical protein
VSVKVILLRDFARARDVLADGSIVTKRVLLAVAGFLALYFSLSAQETNRPDVFGPLNDSFVRFSSLTLSDEAHFSFAGAIAPSLLFNWMETTTPDFLPALNMANMVPRSPKTAALAAPVEDSSKEVVDVRRPKLFDYAGGEAGFLYGRSIGKYGGEVEAGYILGEVGNDKFQISAGMSYEHSSGRFPSFGH